MEFFCKLCEKKYKSYQSLWNHNNKFHQELNIQIINDNKIDSKFKCTYCNMGFKYNHSMKIHMEKSCKRKGAIMEQNKNIIEENNKLKKEVELLKQQIKPSIKNNGTINGNVNNGTINNTINNTIYINKTGTENLLELNEMEVNEIFNNNISGIISLIKFINFNERLPANHSFCTKSLEGKYMLVYNNDTSKIESSRKKYFYQDLLTGAINKMEKLYLDNKNKLKKEKQVQINNTILTLKNLNIGKLSNKLLIEMKNKLVELSYNCRDTVLKTWDNNNLKSVETDDNYSEYFCDIVKDTIEICDKAKDGLNSDDESSDDETISNNILSESSEVIQQILKNKCKEIDV